MPQVATLVELTNAQAAYETAYHEALSLDKIKVANRDDCRFILNGMLKKMAPYVEIVAQGNVSVLETSGYDLRHDNTRNNTTEPLPAPIGFSVAHGAFSGSVDLKVTSLQGAGSYEVQSTQLDPIIEANWAQSVLSKTASHIQVTGLTPGKNYWFRLRAVGSNGVGLWTEPLNIMVL